MPIFEIMHDRIEMLRPTTFAEAGIHERTDLQRLLRAQIGIISPDTLIVSEEFGEWEDSRRRIDLLGVDKAGNLVVVELKRTDDGGHMELQALRYAAMVSTMTFARVVEVYRDYLASHNQDVDPEQSILEFLNWAAPDEEAFAQDVRIVLASAEFSVELTTAVLWLNERDLDIRCVRLKPYADGDRTFLDVHQVIPLPEAESLQIKIRAKAQAERAARGHNAHWSGIWFVNVGLDDGGPRDWEQCVRLGFLSAGGGRRYSGALKQLRVGDKIVAYQSGSGYVGYGIVNQEVSPVSQFQLTNGQPLAVAMPNLDRWPNDDEKNECAVGIEWTKTVPRPEAKWFRGAFANQNVVCKLSHATTVEFLQREFGVEPQTTAATN